MPELAEPVILIKVPLTFRSLSTHLKLYVERLFDINEI